MKSMVFEKFEFVLSLNPSPKRETRFVLRTRIHSSFSFSALALKKKSIENDFGQNENESENDEKRKASLPRCFSFCVTPLTEIANFLIADLEQVQQLETIKF
jgi:hypothetical protein